MNLKKFVQVCCAWCGSLVHGKGWFCSFKCDEHERNERIESYHARQEASGARADGIGPRREPR